MFDGFAAARVAVLDDNRNFQALMRTMLRHAGFRQIDVFGDPGEALDHVADVAVDLIFVDLVMPRQNGVEWVRAVRRSPNVVNPDMGIVLMSGHAVRAVLEPAVSAGIDAFLVKPISPETLLRHARRLLVARPPYVGGPDGYWGPDFRLTRRRIHAIEQGQSRRRIERPTLQPAFAPPTSPAPRSLPGLDVEIVDRSRYHSDRLFLD
jgi:CheY-like chemotaxis protein